MKPVYIRSCIASENIFYNSDFKSSLYSFNRCRPVTDVYVLTRVLLKFSAFWLWYYLKLLTFQITFSLTTAFNSSKYFSYISTDFVLVSEIFS
jgi:hypothetical protein